MKKTVKNLLQEWGMGDRLAQIRQEVDKITDKLSEPIDAAVKELVIGLMYQGIKTEQSCGGHPPNLDTLQTQYPWVETTREPDQVIRLAKAAVRGNTTYTRTDGKDNNVKWVLAPGASIRIQPEDTKRPLTELQNDAREFGLFLQREPEGELDTVWVGTQHYDDEFDQEIGLK